RPLTDYRDGLRKQIRERDAAPAADATPETNAPEAPATPDAPVPGENSVSPERIDPLVNDDDETYDNLMAALNNAPRSDNEDEDYDNLMAALTEAAATPDAPATPEADVAESSQGLLPPADVARKATDAFRGYSDGYGDAELRDRRDGMGLYRAE